MTRISHTLNIFSSLPFKFMYWSLSCTKAVGRPAFTACIISIVPLLEMSVLDWMILSPWRHFMIYLACSTLEAWRHGGAHI